MIEEARDIVCDTGPILHLDELGCLDLLADFKEILLSGRYPWAPSHGKPCRIFRPFSNILFEAIRSDKKYLILEKYNSKLGTENRGCP
jgi:hypothetical protein